MSQAYLKENYPQLYSDASVVATMPDMRDLKTEWARKKVGAWNVNAAWNAIVDDIDAIASLEDVEKEPEQESENDQEASDEEQVNTENYKELFALLLEQKISPSRSRLLTIMQYDLKSFVELFSALSYVLLADINVLPALLSSHHLATKTLLLRNKDKIAAFIHQMLNPLVVSAAERVAAKKAAPTKKGGKVPLVAGKRVVPLEEQYGWKVDDLFNEIDTDENAALILSLVAAEDREKFIRHNRIRHDCYMLRAVFDDGARSDAILSELIELDDETRVLQWISTLKREPLWIVIYPDDDDRGRKENENLELFNLILQSQMKGAIRALTRLYDGDPQYEELIVDTIINELTISATALRTIANYYGERMKKIWKEIDLRESLMEAIMNNNADILKILIDQTDVLSIASISLGEDSDDDIHPLEFALRMSGGTGILDLLVPHYDFNPYDVLRSIMDDLKIEQWDENSRGVRYLLNNYPFTERQLYGLIQQSDSVEKIHAIIEFLYRDISEEMEEYHRPVYTLKEKKE